MALPRSSQRAGGPLAIPGPGPADSTAQNLHSASRPWRPNPDYLPGLSPDTPSLSHVLLAHWLFRVSPPPSVAHDTPLADLRIPSFTPSGLHSNTYRTATSSTSCPACHPIATCIPHHPPLCVSVLKPLHLSVSPTHKVRTWSCSLPILQVPEQGWELSAHL